MKTTTTLIAICGLLSASSALAKGKGYGMAGCGLGSQLFMGKNDQVSQILGATTNGTSGNQTFGISSGTSNCTDQGVVTSQIPMFIETNQIALANDIARGNGETLAHLSKVMGCSDTGRFNTTLQKNYGEIFTTDNIRSSQVTNSILDVIKNDSKLAGNCKNII